MVEVREVRTRKERKIFAGFNERMYRNVPQAIPDMISDERDNFNPKKNPAFAFCEVKCWLAFRDGEPVGRIAGIVNRAANEKWKTKRIRFSRVDFIDDREVSEALFQAVEEWGRSLGLQEIHGPIGFCDMDQEGMLIEGFEEEGMLITIHNAPYYREHLEALHYQKDVDWLEFRIQVPEQGPETLRRLNERALKRYHLRLLEVRSRREIKPYIVKAFDLLNRTYNGLYGTVPLTPDLIRKYYRQFMLLINPAYVKLLVDEEDCPVGLGFAVPSLNRAAKKSKGRLFPWGWYRILRAPFRNAEILDLYLIGVAPEYQNKGLTAVLLYAMAEEARRRGIRFAETGPELESNRQVQGLWKFFETRQHRRRRCFVKSLEI